MATRTWTAAVNTDFQNVGNWTEGAYAVNGDTIVIASETAPTTNRPSTPTDVFHFSVVDALVVTLDHWLNGALIGNVVVNHASAEVTCTAAVTGTTTVTAGALTASGNLGDNPADTVTIDASGALRISGPITIAGAVANGGVFQVVAPFAITCAGLFTNNGLVDGVDGSSIDFNGGVAGTGGTWGSGVASVLTLVSSADFNLMSATWNVAPGSSLTIDDTATVNLGTTEAIADLTMHVTAGAGKTVTLAGAPSVAGFVLNTDGTLAGGGVTLTLDAGKFEVLAGTVAGILNVICGSGGFMNIAVDTGGGTINLAVPTGVTCEGVWIAYSDTLPRLTVDGDCTLGMDLEMHLSALFGAGTVNIGANLLLVRASGNNFYNFTGTMTGSGFLGVELGEFDRVNAGVIIGPIDGTTEFNFVAATLLATGGVSCGAFSLDGTLDLNGGNLNTNGKAVAIGFYVRSGRLVLASGRHSLGSVVKGGTGTANALTLGGIVNFSGAVATSGIATTFSPGARVRLTGANTWTGTTGGAVTHAGGAEIDCLGKGRVTALDASAAAQRIVVRRAVNSAGMPMRSWNGDGCTNVRFLGRKVIGQAA